MLSVILCTHNRSRSLATTLASVSRILPPSGESWELIVVDNNSADDTAQVIQSFAASAPFEVRYVFERKTGLSHARNSGIAEARGEILAFTDDDVTIDSGWLRELKQTFDRFDCLGVGGRIVQVWNFLKPPSWLVTEGPGSLMSAILGFELGPEPCQMKIAPFGANMAFRRMAFEKYGLFRTDLGKVGTKPMTGEDTEFGNRLLAQGERLAYSPHAVVYHPVDKERTTKKYFERWYFNYGRSMALVAHFPAGAIRYFGVPRYLFRDAISSFGQWILTLDPTLRFRRKLHLLLCLGEISEARRLVSEQES